jgi:hypothetical protein
MVDAADAGLIGARDRPPMLLGFAGAFRRSELVGLDVEDCTFGKDGLTVTLRRSKTDQDGAGRKIGIPYGSNPETCPVRTVEAWLAEAGAEAGPLFRSIMKQTGHRTCRWSGATSGTAVCSGRIPLGSWGCKSQAPRVTFASRPNRDGFQKFQEGFVSAGKSNPLSSGRSSSLIHSK